MEVAETLTLQARTLQPDAWRSSVQGSTSTGIAHSWREPQPWNGENMERTTMLPLPPTLRGSDLSTGQAHLTTTRMHHAYQPQGTILDHPVSKRAPACYKVHYNEGFTGKLAERQWRRPLDIAYQCSEYEDRYRHELPRTLVPSEHGQDLRPHRLGDHHSTGPLKDLVPTQKSASLHGWSVPTQDQGVFYNNEIYMSKATNVHRNYSRHEQMELPRPNQATYWHSEQYPRAWGYGSQDAVMSQFTTQPVRGREMRDRMTFSTGTRLIPPTHQLPPLPNSGQSLAQASYLWPSTEERRNLFYCPVQHQSPQHGSNQMTNAPEMYKTQNMVYGQQYIA